jgi:hypothetical protein
MYCLCFDGTAVWYCLQMDSIDLLERVLLDGNAKPTCVPLSLLEYITNSFSDDHQIGSGGFAVVYKVRVTSTKHCHRNHGHHSNTTTCTLSQVNARHKHTVSAGNSGKRDDCCEEAVQNFCIA